MTSAQFIACENHAAFTLTCYVMWDDPTFGKKQTPTSPLVSEPFTYVFDMSEYPLTEGTSMTPRVHAELGDTHNGETPVTYAANGLTATYKVTGTTLHFSVDLRPSD